MKPIQRAIRRFTEVKKLKEENLLFYYHGSELNKDLMALEFDGQSINVNLRVI